MVINDFINLKVGDRVVFTPRPGFTKRQFESSSFSYFEKIFENQEYFVSRTGCSFDNKNMVNLRNIFSDNKRQFKFNEQPMSTWIVLDNVSEPIQSINFTLFKKNRYNISTINERDISQFGNSLMKNEVYPSEFLSLKTMYKNLGEVTMDEYKDFYEYSINFYEPTTFKKFKSYNWPTPLNSTQFKEFEKYNQINAIKKNITKNNYKFINKVMDYVKNNHQIDIYYEFMNILSEGIIPSNELFKIYKETTASKDEWIIHAAYGSKEFLNKIIDYGKK